MTFFGDQTSTLETLEELHPELFFKTLQQTHSDIICQFKKDSPENGGEGDALWTEDSNVALAVSTADCIPILISAPDVHRVAAIHAGWRGVESRITYKTLKDVFSQSSSIEVFIGPHITFKSFEVDFVVKNKLYKCTQKPMPTAFVQLRSGKFQVNLVDLVLNQIQEAFSGTIKVQRMEADTKTNVKYYSHRREPQNKGRQISFISQD